MTCLRVAKGNRKVMQALLDHPDFLYADMEDIALILKGIVVYPEGRIEATLLDGRTVSLSYTHTTREHKWALHTEDKLGVCQHCGTLSVQDPKRKRKRFCSSRCCHV